MTKDWSSQPTFKLELPFLLDITTILAEWLKKELPTPDFHFISFYSGFMLNLPISIFGTSRKMLRCRYFKLVSKILQLINVDWPLYYN